jgi:predicted O-methyltransferase YrrM
MTDRYIQHHTTAEDEILAKLYRETHLRVLNPRMLSGPVQGKLLEMISRMISPQRILEIGTYTGYSAICLARGLAPDGVLHTIEVNPELDEISFKYFRLANLEKRIVRHTGDALPIIPVLEETFDLVFIDAAKEHYPDYYRVVFDKVRQGGFIIADNVLWDGKVVHQSKNPDRETAGIIAFNDLVQGDDRVENVMLSDRDGLMIIRKK